VPGGTCDFPVVIVVREKDKIIIEMYSPKHNPVIFFCTHDGISLNIKRTDPNHSSFLYENKPSVINTMHHNFVPFDTVLFVFNVELRSLR